MIKANITEQADNTLNDSIGLKEGGGITVAVGWGELKEGGDDA
jgi:hypothetical protein